LYLITSGSAVTVGHPVVPKTAWRVQMTQSTFRPAT